jgi:uncharacterized ferritin-like protein (DUF455 family)
MPDPFPSLADAACAILNSPSCEEKISKTNQVSADWRQGRITKTGACAPPDRPARPPRPELKMPRDMPRRRMGSEKGRIALIHAIAHIELNAIDLAWDIVARFTSENLPREFYDDWISVAVDEARHFQLLNGYLQNRGVAYGHLAAHDGLWQAARDSADDLLARLAIVPLVLEARGLDTTPGAVKRLHEFGDIEAADILATIAEEEIPHVAFGVKWFTAICDKRGLRPEATFQALVRSRFKGKLKAPFATDARSRAGFMPEFYEPLAD